MNETECILRSLLVNLFPHFLKRHLSASIWYLESVQEWNERCSRSYLYTGVHVTESLWVALSNAYIFFYLHLFPEFSRAANMAAAGDINRWASGRRVLRPYAQHCRGQSAVGLWDQIVVSGGHVMCVYEMLLQQILLKSYWNDT